MCLTAVCNNFRPFPYISILSTHLKFSKSNYRLVQLFIVLGVSYGQKIKMVLIVNQAKYQFYGPFEENQTLTDTDLGPKYTDPLGNDAMLGRIQSTSSSRLAKG